MTYTHYKDILKTIYNLTTEQLIILRIGFEHTQPHPIRDQIIDMIKTEIKYR